MTALRVFIPFALGYFLSYLLRVVNAVIAPDLVGELGLDAADLGLLTSVYFFAFAAVQLPIGIMLDRFGPRRTEAALLIFAAAGAFIFAASETATGLIIGRALIGMGVAACLMAAFKAFVLWFPSERLPFVNGCQMAVGGLGALTGTVPVEAALEIADWRGVFFAFGILVAAAALAIFMVVPERETRATPSTFAKQLGGFAQVFRSPLFWRVAPLTVTAQGSFLSVQSLWSGPWLRDVAGLDRPEVARHLLLIAVAMVAGFLLVGAIADRLSRFGIRPIAVTLVGIGIFVVAQAAIAFQWSDAVLPMWMTFGFFGTSGILPYALLSQAFPSHLTGRAVTSLNVLVFSAAFLLQWGIGAVINRWPAAADGAYPPDAYQAGFILMLALQISALVWFFAFRRAEVRLRA